MNTDKNKNSQRSELEDVLTWPDDFSCHRELEREGRCIGMVEIFGESELPKG